MDVSSKDDPYGDSTFCIIEGRDTVLDFAPMQLQEIREHINMRRNKIFLLMEEVFSGTVRPTEFGCFNLQANQFDTEVCCCLLSHRNLADSFIAIVTISPKSIAALHSLLEILKAAGEEIADSAAGQICRPEFTTGR